MMFVFYAMSKGSLKVFANNGLMKEYVKENGADDFGKTKLIGYKEEKKKDGVEPDWQDIKLHLILKFKEYYPNKTMDKTKFLAEFDAFKGYYQEQNWCRRSKGKLIPIKNWKSTATRWFSKSFSRLINYRDKNSNKKQTGWV